MAYVNLLFCALLLYNTNLVSSTVYSCDRTTACGCSKVNANVNKIVGGESAADSSWGWAVSLQRNNGGAFCGGAIISPLHIITAAHCVKNSSAVIQNTKVVVGIDKLTQSTLSMAQVRSVVRVISHPEYNDYSKTNDIAILRLDRPLIISNEYGTARLCLPNVVSTSTVDNYPVAGSSLVAIGWGLLQFGTQLIPNNLQQVTLTAIPAYHSMCKYTVNNQQLQFCAAVTGGGKDTCQGDSGGPLMRFESDELGWVLAGLTSYGKDCGLPSYSGVYTRVSVYRNWLRSIVTDSFVEVPVSATSSVLLDSARSKLLSSWSLSITLYIFTPIRLHI